MESRGKGAFDGGSPSEKDLFLAALDQAPEAREEYIREACHGDEGLRRQVIDLLVSHERPEPFLEKPSGEILVPLSSEPVADRMIGERLSGAVIRSVISAGGMGVVYLAEQANPARKVAVKVLRPGAASPTMVRRFEFEAKILGRLQHPGVAQIFEAGTVDLGFGPQPYFVMEYVEGVPLVEFAEGRKLGVRERVGLLIRTCRAVQYVHGKGVIHRDLKPANILVNAAGQPKVLDFGVARSKDPDLRRTGLCTLPGDMVGTPPYMSPEQILGDPEDLDARSDVYALGVLGYQMLSGRLPHDTEGKNLIDAARTICENEPEPLRLGDAALESDFRAVFRKVLEKDRDRRYQTAQELADDLERVLKDEPVKARADTKIYQLRKFVRRNRTLVLGLAGATAALLVGLAAAVMQARRAEEERARAVAAEQAAQEQANRTSRLLNFLERTIAPLPTEVGFSTDTTLKQVLDRMSGRGLARIREADPRSAVALEDLFGRAYLTLHLYDQAKAFLTRSLEARLATSDPDLEALAYNLYWLGICQGRLGDDASAKKLLLEAASLAQTQGAHAAGLLAEVQIQLESIRSAKASGLEEAVEEPAQPR